MVYIWCGKWKVESVSNSQCIAMVIEVEPPARFQRLVYGMLRKTLPPSVDMLT